MFLIFLKLTKEEFADYQKMCTAPVAHNPEGYVATGKPMHTYWTDLTTYNVVIYAPETAAAEGLAKAFAEDRFDFCGIKAAMMEAGAIPATCREVSWYHYTRKGSGVKVREPGAVARAFCDAIGVTPPAATSWAAGWPRTKRSIAAEADGTRFLDALCAAIKAVRKV